MNKITWAKMMVGQIGHSRDVGTFRITSWVNPDKGLSSDIIVFIVENEIGFPATIEKKCLKKYDEMTEEEIKRAFCHKDFPTENFFRFYDIERKEIKQQIQDHRLEQ